MNPASPVLTPCEQERLRRAQALRVAVICDLLEERWPSMDLIGDMLFQNLAEHCGDVFASQLRPSFERRGSVSPEGKLTRNFKRWMWRFVYYPRWLRSQRDNYDVFHIVDHSYSQLVRNLPAARTVVTCHDLDTFRCLIQPDADPRPAWFRAMAGQILDGFRQATHVIAVSEVTRAELVRYRLARPESITVIPNGVHPSCSPLPVAETDREASELTGTGNAPVLLNVGNTLARKRVDVFLRVAAAVRKDIPNIRIVRIGELTPEHRKLAADLDLDRSMVCLPFLERNVLAAVYRSATVLLHTAEAEGFGLPVIEALACGCPVVASDIPVLREVAGAAGTYCPVAEIDAWRDAVTALVRESVNEPEQWRLRRNRGLEQAAHFSWAENARMTARVYQDVTKSSAS